MSTGMRTTVVWVPDWPVAAAVRTGGLDPARPVAVYDGHRLTAVSALARAQGVRRGMRQRQAQGCCPELALLAADPVRDLRAFEPVAVAVEEVVPGIEVARPGLLLLPTSGASRYHGSEDELADRIVTVVADHTGHECHVGIADGLLAAVLAARSDLLVPAGGSRAFLSPRPVADLGHGAVRDGEIQQVDILVDLLDRLGVRTLGALAGLPEADVHARFGPVGAWAHRLARGEDTHPPVRRRPEADLEVTCELDPPAQRVDIATFAGRRLAEQLHAVLVDRGVTCGSLRIAARTGSGDELVRTWRTDLSGGLSPSRITDRVRWQLEGWLTDTSAGRVPSRAEDPEPGALVRLTLTAQEVAPAGAEQGRLWGGPSGGDLRAHRVLDRVQATVGGDGVLTAVLQGGRDPRAQVHLRPWGDRTPPPRPVDRPWPGRLPAPAPATVPVAAEPVDVLDAGGAPVRIDDRWLLSAAPARVRVGDRDVGVVGWAGPWPLAERWWAGGPRRAYVQVALDDGRALLLAAGTDGWACEATYD